MTPEQRYDLSIEWLTTHPAYQEKIKQEYRLHYGKEQTEQHWENFLAEKLNMKTFWKAVGLL